MKVIAINGSPRENGNTAFLLQTVFEPLESHGIETEYIHLGQKPISGCLGCGKCYEKQNMKCCLTHDSFNQWFPKLVEADGILLGSPVYFADITANMKAFIERAGMVSRANFNALARKAGASVIAVRRAGGVHSFDSLNHFFLISQMIVVGSSYWNIGIGRNAGDCENDVEGINTMIALGNNMAWLLGKIKE